jgi:hypothetical protein
MKRSGLRQAVVAVAVFACGTMGSIERSSEPDPPQGLLRGDFTVSASTAAACETRGEVSRPSCLRSTFGKR